MRPRYRRASGPCGLGTSSPHPLAHAVQPVQAARIAGRHGCAAACARPTALTLTVPDPLAPGAFMPGAGGACSYVRQGGPGHRFAWRWPAAFRVMFHAIPSFGPHCGRGAVRRSVFRPLASAGTAAIRTAHPGGQRGCCTGIHAAGHISPGEGNHHTPNRHPAGGGGDRGLCHPNGKLSLDTPVETGSRLGLTARETPASVTVVDRATIEARGAQDPGNLAGRARRDRARCAGQRGRELPWFWQRLAGPVVQRHHGAVQHCGAPVDSWIYDRVEAIGGPSSFLFGSGAVGGSINYITKTPERTDFTEAQVRAGSHRLREVSIGINRRLGSAATAAGGGTAHYARLDLNHRDGGSWTEGTERRATQLATSLLSDLGGGWSHLLAYEYQNENVHRPYWGTPCCNRPWGVAH